MGAVTEGRAVAEVPSQVQDALRFVPTLILLYFLSPCPQG